MGFLVGADVDRQAGSIRGLEHKGRRSSCLLLIGDADPLGTIPT